MIARAHPDPAGPRGHAAGLTDRRSERDALDRLVNAVRGGQSQALVVRGDPGVGKTALLDYLAGRARGCRVARVVGVQSEMELAFAGLHQLCAPMLGRAERLPAPQHDALRTAFGLAAGPPPDRFLVGLAVLSLLSEVAGEQPLICLIDDEQWLDQASAQALGFVARRLAADPVGLVFAARESGRGAGRVAGARSRGAARERRTSAAGLGAGRADRCAGPGPDRGRDAGQPAGAAGAAAGAVARGTGGRVRAARCGAALRADRGELPPAAGGAARAARRLLLLAAAEPYGDLSLVWRAAGRLGIPVQAAAPAVDAGLVEFGGRVRFRHPLVRSAVVPGGVVAGPAGRARARWPRSPTRRLTPERRAWHRAQAVAGPDEDVAAELERSAGRAQARGGLAAAAAFLERSVLLTADPARRTPTARWPRRRPICRPARSEPPWSCSRIGGKGRTAG